MMRRSHTLFKPLPHSSAMHYAACMYEFDQDTNVEPLGDGRYRARITERWSIGPVPNGGYVLAVATRALGHTFPPRDPLAVTAHYLRPAIAGDAEVLVEVAKVGKKFATASARLVQQGDERIRVLATFGVLEELRGPTYVDAEPPRVPDRDEHSDLRASARLPEIARRFRQQLAPETMRWAHGERGERAEIRGRVRFADGRDPDATSLVLFADALPPPVFNVIAPGWVPTLELSVQVRARPAPGWLSALFRTRFLGGGLLEEDGELWDERGRLVALSRQLAAVPR